MGIVTADDQVNLFSEYPKESDEFFEQKKLVFKVIPDDLLELEEELTEIKITTTKEFCDYLNCEIEFWKTQDPEGKLKAFSQIDRLISAKSNLDSALNYFKSNNTTQGKNNLSQSVSAVSHGCLYSKTRMASFVLQYKGASSGFLRGLRNGLLKDRTMSINATVADYEGIMAAFAFREHEEKIMDALGGNVENIKRLSEEVMQKYADLDARYVMAFHEQQERIASITKQTNQHLQDLDNETANYFSGRDKRCAELEQLYDEKLKLEAPAKYWEDMKKSYSLSGGIWFATSVIMAAGIIVGLVMLLTRLPNIFTEDSHWMDVFKNSAIITIITSVAVYILRIMVKMAMSSFHLARDAKERNNLSFFYLALIHDKAITDKERALVINALFSRSDTGLLKSEAGPTMSNNVADLVETIAKK